MATSSERYVGIDVSKDRLDVAVLGERQEQQVDNTSQGIAQLVARMLELQPELIVVEATGGYQRAVVEALLPSRTGSGGGEPSSRKTVRPSLWLAGQDRQAGCPGAGGVWAARAA
jgi:hypothetical protein